MTMRHRAFMEGMRGTNFNLITFRLSYIGFLSLPAWALVIVTYHLIVEVFHVLISLLAIEKFLIYFFPSWEKNVLIVQKFVQKYILLLYLGCCLKYALLYALESWFGGGRGWELSYGVSC